MPKPYNPHDKWMEKAKKEGFRARSVYKLQELDTQHHLLHFGMKVLDIGAAPGSWLQYISQQIGQQGLALGIDLQEIQPVADNVITKVVDITQKEEVDKAIQSLGWEKVDLVVSDIMPNTTGIKIVDQKRSIDLSKQVFAIAQRWLKPKGFLVMKVFEGEGFSSLIKELKAFFSQVKVTQVQASRDRSREVYIICR